MENKITAAFRTHKPNRKTLPDIAGAIEAAPIRSARYKRMGAFKAGSNILDVGCAWGAILLGLPDSVSYTGIDVNWPSIRIACDVFGDRGDFIHLNAKEPKYNPNGPEDSAEIELPFPDGSFDSVLCCSLFTHFTRRDAVENYLAEISRVLKVGGRLLSTWFRSPPNAWGGTDRRYAWKESTIEGAFLPGQSWIWANEEKGKTTERDDQWHIVTVKR
jgi:ubiquinone/menaquinone biosynthesis C-methylase UbiE